MKMTANIATYQPREESLKKVLPSLLEQFDEVRVYFNSFEKVPEWASDMGVKGVVGEDLTDNAKFYFLNTIKAEEYYFTCDDDLIYPKDYLLQTISALNRYGGIITHHGRKLLGKHSKYYGVHKVYHCLGHQPHNINLDVCGSGVSAFFTRDFNPKELAFDSRKKMADLLMSLEAARNGVDITIIPHRNDWFKHINNAETIHKQCSYDDEIQAELANEIYDLIYDS